MAIFYQFIGRLLDLIYGSFPMYGTCIVILAFPDKVLLYFVEKSIKEPSIDMCLNLTNTDKREIAADWQQQRE
jgi:hypothetical protein